MPHSERYCPGCGVLWAQLPTGHTVAYPMDGTKPRCEEAAPPVTPEEFIASGRRR